ncbi:MAG: aminoacetone oxidase family FAD-binding enzyme, partial [Proteobacteria bacterium]
SNAGWSFRAPDGFFAKAEGKPIKGLTLTTALGVKTGELMITRYGLEGTPVYTLGTPGFAVVDLKPDLAEEKLAARLAPFRGDRAQKLSRAKLSEGAALFFEALAPPEAWDSAAAAAHAMKHLKVEFLAARSLAECISAKGGVSWGELTEELELKNFPGIYCAGEMIDWDAPTGGFLLQASVSTGFVAGEAAAKAGAANA